jgi:hypothetical protein
MQRRFIGLALAGTLALTLTACGDDDDDDVDTGATTVETTAETTADTTAETTAETTADTGTTETTEAAAGEVIEVTGIDYGYEGIPEEPIAVGTLIEFHNATEAGELHEFVALPIPADETRSIGELLQLPEAELDALFGTAEPAMVLLAGPGDDPLVTAVGDGTFTEPGRYAIICAIPVGADPATILESEGPPAEDPNAGPPHFTEGMAAEITVE